MLTTNVVSLPLIYSPNHVSRDEGTDSDDVDSKKSLEDRRLMHTQMMMLDYKQFKAARLIQRQVRGFLARFRLRRMQWAAKILAKAWLKYVAQKKQTARAERRLQAIVTARFTEASIRIQAHFRGFSSRKHINNMASLKKIQTYFLGQILEAFAQRLHTMRRNGELPGYLNFCKQPEYSKIRSLLTMFTYRLYNRLVCKRFVINNDLMLGYRREFLDSILFTKVPYYGFNDIPESFEKATKDDEASLYCALRKFDLGEARQSTSMAKHEKSIHKELIQQRFCQDILTSMKYWHACPMLAELKDEDPREYLKNAKECLEQMDLSPGYGCKSDDLFPCD